MMDKVIEGGRTCIVAMGKTHYADDALAFLLIRVAKMASEEERNYTIKSAFETVRNLTICATNRTGGSINKSKSESILPAKYCESFNAQFNTGRAKEDQFPVSPNFKWIGFFLELQDNAQLHFSEPHIESALITVSRKQLDFNQYTSVTKLKLQVWRTYILPFIEMFAILAIQDKSEKRNCVHKFQHRSLTAAIGLCSSAGYDTVRKLTGELSVRDRAIRIARRLARFIPDEELYPQDPGDLTGTSTDRSKNTGMQLRSGRAKLVGEIKPELGTYLIFRIGLFARMTPDDPEQVNKKIKKKINFGKLKAEVGEVNKSIRKKIQGRSRSSTV